MAIPRLLIAAMIFSSSLMAAETAQWPQWRGPDRNGISLEKGWVAEWPKEGPKKLWSASVGTGCSCVVVANGKVYTMGNDGKPVKPAPKPVPVVPAKLDDKTPGAKPADAPAAPAVPPPPPAPVDQDTIYCLNADTGEVVWKYSYVQPLEPSGFDGGPCSTPCIDGNRLYATNKRGRVFCLDADKGTVIWDSNPQEKVDKGVLWGGIAASPIIEGDTLFSGSTAYEKATGKVKWTVKSGCHWSSPMATTLDGKRVLLIFNEQGVSCIDFADGSQKWQFPWGCAQAAADPILQGNELFLSSRNTGPAASETALVKISLAGAELVWKNKNLMSYFHVRVLCDGMVLGCDEKELKCVDFKTGEIKWTGPGWARGQVAIAGDKLLLMIGGKLIVGAVSATGFKELARLQVVGGGISVPPVLCGGRIYCRGSSGENNLVCLDVSAK
jgi:outer membrane protein assembly factor BamB